jgi:DNA polymerase-3 subunit epsilon/CBS domain-containing protein
MGGAAQIGNLADAYQGDRMPDIVIATPLVGLDAIVVDTETTGLDPRKARIIEIGAVRIAAGRIEADAGFATLVRPGMAIPAESSAVHGIVDADLADAPGFADAWTAYAGFAANAVVIGHSIGFDLAILKRQCEEARIPFTAPVALDTRFLAQIAEPRLPGFTLEMLAAWLEVETGDRHRAMGDALTTARIFHALVPRLRERGVRTVGEALTACRRLADAMEPQGRAGWLEPGAPPSGEAALRRIDAYPYRHRVRDLMSKPPIFMPREATLETALKLMADRKISSLFVGDADEQASAVGIVTERDVLRFIAKEGANAFVLPIGDLASRPLATVPAEAFVYRAIGRMSGKKIRHLAAVSADGRVAGAISARDLLRLRASTAIELGDDIDTAASVGALGRAWAKLPAMARALQSEDVPARDIAGVIARELGALTRRASQLARERLAAEGVGEPPCRWAVLVLGSAGRGESLLAMDQDNAIVFELGEPGGPEDRYFERMGGILADILHEVGVPYCPGGVMASKPAFRGSLATWKERVDTWISRSKPEDILSVDIFYDFRMVDGDGALASDLWTHAWTAAKGRNAFLKLLAADDIAGAAPIGFFGRLRADEDGRIDLKRHLLKPIVTTARILALKHGAAVHSSADRLAGVRATGSGGAEDLARLDEAHERALRLVLRTQLKDIGSGKPPSNRVVVADLDRDDTDGIKADMQRLSSIDELVRSQLSG